MFDQAVTAYEEALKSNPKLGPVTLKLAQLYAGPLHNAKKAMEFAKKARKLSTWRRSSRWCAGKDCV